MTTIFFLRHGPTQENQENRIQGQQPGTLIIEKTQQYLAAIAPIIQEKIPTTLLSSDLERAVQTRNVLKGLLSLPELKEGTTPLLREKAMGFYEGMLWEEVPPGFKEQRGKQNYDFRQFGGENEDDVRARVAETLRRFAQEYPGERLCCVTHAGWIEQLVKIADKQGVLQDSWSNRQAIYEAGVGPIGQLLYFHPIAIEAELPIED